MKKTLYSLLFLGLSFNVSADIADDLAKELSVNQVLVNATQQQDILTTVTDVLTIDQSLAGDVVQQGITLFPQQAEKIIIAAIEAAPGNEQAIIDAALGLGEVGRNAIIAVLSTDPSLVGDVVRQAIEANPELAEDIILAALDAAPGSEQAIIDAAVDAGVSADVALTVAIAAGVDPTLISDPTAASAVEELGTTGSDLFSVVPTADDPISAN